MNGDLVRGQQFGRAAEELDLGTAIGKTPDPDFPPADRPGPRENLKRLVDRFLGCEPGSEGGGRIAQRIDVGALTGGQGAVEDPTAVASQERPRPRQLDHIETNGHYGHGRLQNARLTGANHPGAGS